MWAHNGGLGAYLCRGCRTMVCEEVGVYAAHDDARIVHRLSAVVGKPCGRVFCSPRCAADGGLSANEYVPMFSAGRIKMGNRADVLDADWYACPECCGSGTAGTGDPEAGLSEYLCKGCGGDGHRRVCASWVSRPATPAWAKP